MHDPSANDLKNHCVLVKLDSHKATCVHLVVQIPQMPPIPATFEALSIYYLVVPDKLPLFSRFPNIHAGIGGVGPTSATD